MIERPSSEASSISPFDAEEETLEEVEVVAVEEAEVVEASMVDRSVQTGEGLLLQTVLIVRPPARTDVLNKFGPLKCYSHLPLSQYFALPWT